MGHYKGSVLVRLPQDAAFDAWLDVGRYPQWQGGVLDVIDPTGPLDQVGTTYRLDHGPGMKRTVTILEVNRPDRFRIRQEGVGVVDETEVRFEAEGHDATRVSVALDMRMGAVGKFFERLSQKRSTAELRKELDRFAAVVARPVPDVVGGDLLSADSGAGHRLLRVIALEDRVVHLQIYPGTAPRPIADPEPFLGSRSALANPLGLQPLQPSLRASTSIVAAGQPLLRLDGGLGTPHLAMTVGALADGRVVALPDHRGPTTGLDEVGAWAAAAGPVLGRDLGASIVPLISFVDGDRFGVAKVLRSEMRGAHVRSYSDRWPARPATLNPWLLHLDPPDPTDFSKPIGIGHMPVSIGSFQASKPEFVRLVMRSNEELDGYRMWKDAKGGWF